MLRKCAAVLAVVSCLTGATSIRAEPGPVGQWLMGEPASLFDIGMLRLEMATQSWEQPQHKFNIEMKPAYGSYPTYHVAYDWDQNRIVIGGWLLENIDEKAEAEAACKEIISHISSLASVTTEPGFYLFGFTSSSFARYFSHFGYEVKGAAPEDYKSRLDQIFLIKATIMSKDARQLAACSRRLLSTKVHFEE